jgi:hypothetical protein
LTQSAPVQQLAYVSRRSPGITDDVVVDEIAIPSIRRNLANDITGALWFNHDRFFQIIEGPPDRVDRLYDNIERDGRHTDCRALCRRLIAERSFSRWQLKVFRGEFPRDLNELLRRTAPGYIDTPKAAPVMVPEVEDDRDAGSALMGLLRGGLAPLQRVIAEMTSRDDHLPT